MKEEEKKDEKPVEGAEEVQGKAMDFSQVDNTGNKPAEGGEKGDDDKDGDDKPTFGGGPTTLPIEK